MNLLILGAKQRVLAAFGVAVGESRASWRKVGSGVRAANWLVARAADHKIQLDGLSPYRTLGRAAPQPVWAALDDLFGTDGFSQMPVE